MRYPQSIPFISLTLALCICLGYSNAHAQQGVWDSAKKGSKKINAQAKKSKLTIKRWKEHINEWAKEDEYNKQLAVGGKLNNNGWSGGIYYLKKTEPGKHVIWQLSFSEIKQEKQVKQQKENKAYPALGKSSPFVYGKINNLYTLHIGYGHELLLLPGVVSGNLSVSFRYGAGFSLAMLKPYYLKIVHINNTSAHPTPELKEEKYSGANADTFLRNQDILGASKWSKGLGETRFTPGLYAEAAFAIEPAKQKGFVQTIMIGGNIAYYTKALPIMAEVKALPWQGSLFVGLSLGKRWK